MSLLPLDTTFLIDAERRGLDLDEVIGSMPIIAYDVGVAVEHSQLLATVRKEGRPRGAHDLLTAATARTTDRTIVSADPGAFADIPGVTTISHR